MGLKLRYLLRRVAFKSSFIQELMLNPLIINVMKKSAKLDRMQGGGSIATETIVWWDAE